MSNDHDPLCPMFDMSKWRPYRGMNCVCTIIAHVRKDEQDNGWRSESLRNSEVTTND